MCNLSSILLLYFLDVVKFCAFKKYKDIVLYKSYLVF